MQLLRLISPVIGTIVASLLALSAIIIFFTNSLDANSVGSERRLLARIIDEVPKNLSVLAEDNSWWDEAVENIVLHENLEWLEQTIGGTIEGIDDIDGAFVLRPDNSIVYSLDKKTAPPDIADLLDNGVRDALGKLQPIDADVGVSSYGYSASAGRVFAIGISMVQPTGFRTFDPPLGNRRRPVILFYRDIDTLQTAEMADAADLRDVQFIASTDQFILPEGRATLTLIGLSDMPVGRFVWAPARPGTALLEQLLWPVVFFLIVILVATISFVQRARSLVNELEQADRTKMAFLASMSHEVRTPLNAIIGFAEILRLELHGEVKGEKNKEYLDIIRTSGEHLLTVINDILNISKLDAGKMEIFAEAMDPVDVIAESIRMVENAAQDRSIRLVQELESSTILSDERIIRQILINILSNAVKFTPADGQVSVRSEITPTGYKIIVSDTGVGMSGEEIDVALAPFGQVRKNREQSSSGTGLGLPLVNRFIALLGGTMTIRSAPGHGTSVTLEFPEAAPTAALKTKARSEALFR